MLSQYAHIREELGVDVQLPSIPTRPQAG